MGNLCTLYDCICSLQVPVELVWPVRIISLHSKHERMFADAGGPPLLLLIDLQRGIDDPSEGPRNNPDAEETIRHLLSIWREQELPIVHVRHDSKEPDSLLRGDLPGFEYKPGLEPREGEKEFIKRVNGAFGGTELKSWINERGLKTIVICGLVTDHCVSTTAREAEDRGFDVYVVEDGTATFGRTLGTMEFDSDTIHRTALAQLNGEFADIVSTQQIADEVISS